MGVPGRTCLFVLISVGSAEAQGHTKFQPNFPTSVGSLQANMSAKIWQIQIYKDPSPLRNPTESSLPAPPPPQKKKSWRQIVSKNTWTKWIWTCTEAWLLPQHKEHIWIRTFCSVCQYFQMISHCHSFMCVLLLGREVCVRLRPQLAHQEGGPGRAGRSGRQPSA